MEENKPKKQFKTSKLLTVIICITLLAVVAFLALAITQFNSIYSNTYNTQEKSESAKPVTEDSQSNDQAKTKPQEVDLTNLFVFFNTTDNKFIYIDEQGQTLTDLLSIDPTILNTGEEVVSALYNKSKKEAYIVVQGADSLTLKKIDPQGKFVSNLLSEKRNTTDYPINGSYYSLLIGELSPDGKYLNINLGGYEGSTNLVIGTDNGSELTSTTCATPTWSADGARVGFAASGGLCTADEIQLTEKGNLSSWKTVDKNSIQADRSLKDAGFTDLAFLSDQLMILATNEQSARIVYYDEIQNRVYDLLTNVNYVQLARSGSKVIAVDGFINSDGTDKEQQKIWSINNQGKVQEIGSISGLKIPLGSTNKTVLGTNTKNLIIDISSYNEDNKRYDHDYFQVSLQNAQATDILNEGRFIYADLKDQGF